MEITDAMRLRARDFGVHMPDYCAALQRLHERAPGPMVGDPPVAAGVVLREGEDRVRVTVERFAGVALVHGHATDGPRGLAMEPASALRSGWDLIAAADAVRYGWLS